GAPAISIFLKPPGVIPLGGSTTICCSCQCDNGHFVLYRNGKQIRTQELRGSRAEFSISNATNKDAGVYSCHYLDGRTVLARSETVEVKVGEFCLPRPVLSVMPGQDVPAGASVIFRCNITHSNARCYLYQEGAIKASSLFLEGRNSFNITHVHKGNEGRYSCQCFIMDPSFKWSPVSETLDLVVR
ncbi:IGSF1 protein, partial [Balaeniceps rex]|nr:IGSF1 protein [Balaeniceps rex]